ncbi:MAG: hypothetical protein ABEH90_02240 [Halolamina sp.]
MSFSSQILSFLAVSAVYIGFTFVWAWYKGQQEDEPGGPGEAAADTNGGEV